MSRAYASHVLQMAIGQICHTIGWDAVSSLTLEQLVSTVEHFLRNLTRQMVRCSELNNRTESNLDDLAYAFRAFGINLTELEAYTKAVESIPLPFAVPQFPLKPSGPSKLKANSTAIELLNSVVCKEIE
ncbi:transcription initiation factor TFIID subunit 3-like [Anopheles ziemanni]|uniref:transcription initiation factor TFIID subunit 3-like n=1 Tax=Anopheles coustani TaxID=139045 RepID=UPI00265B1657|nr:transcription initiation factor TFIID subunit 3-like [Anopheles coustani]XP_058178388.1 transcription initiation factor TFIID subunit 3-like [Anopheles ziemanni]